MAGKPSSTIIKNTQKRIDVARPIHTNQSAYSAINNILNMLTDIHPKLPMRDKRATRDFYINQLGFHELGNADFDGYLMVQKDKIQIHFFEFKELDPKEMNLDLVFLYHQVAIKIGIT